jgi:hypothetical protein
MHMERYGFSKNKESLRERERGRQYSRYLGRETAVQEQMPCVYDGSPTSPTSIA